MDNDDYCSECGDRGWVEDPLANAMGGRWWRYCSCSHAKILAIEDEKKYPPKLDTRDKLEIAVEALHRIALMDDGAIAGSLPGPYWEVASRALTKIGWKL